MTADTLNGKIKATFDFKFIVQLISMLIPLIWAVIMVAIQVSTLSTKLDGHLNDSNTHMSFQDKAKTFVPRAEIERELAFVSDELSEIKLMLKELRDR